MAMQWKKLLSARRLGCARSAGVQQGRSPFQQDFDRIVFSSSFRLLHDKAQVFPLSDEDHVRTRLTHSIETASIGRSLGAIAGVGICKSLGETDIRPNHIGEIVAAVRDMSRRKCGALIVIERRIKLQMLIDDSIPLDIKVNALVLESIFYPNSPLHDGAVIIRDDRIQAARVILPLTRNEKISPRLGTRHRAALGISDETDAVSVVVSEETGAISITCKEEFHRDLSIPQLEHLLEQYIIQKADADIPETLLAMEECDQSGHLLNQTQERGGSSNVD